MANEWSPQELRNLAMHYHELTAKEMQEKYLPNRSTHAIYCAVIRLGLSEPLHRNDKTWTQEEIEILQEHAGKITSMQIHTQYLPGRTPKAIRHKIQRLDLNPNDMSRDIWTDREIKYLKRYFNKLTVKQIARKLNRSETAVRNRAVILKLSRPDKTRAKTYKRQNWSNTEDMILNQHAGNMTTSEIQAKFMPNRSISSIQHRVQKLHIKRRDMPTEWTPEELAILKNYEHTDIQELKAMLPGRTEKAILGQVGRLGLHKSKTKKGHCKASRENWKQKGNKT